MLKKLDHINIVVSRLEEAKAFFLLLGFRILDEAELAGEWISRVVGLEDVRARYVQLAFPGTGTNLELIEYASPPSGQDPHIGQANRIGFRHIAFEVEDIEDTVQRLGDKGIRFLSPIQSYPEKAKKLVYFWGPDGILLELAEYGSRD